MIINSATVEWISFARFLISESVSVATILTQKSTRPVNNRFFRRQSPIITPVNYHWRSIVQSSNPGHRDITARKYGNGFMNTTVTEGRVFRSKGRDAAKGGHRSRTNDRAIKRLIAPTKRELLPSRGRCGECSMKEPANLDRIPFVGTRQG